jgi:hypothetical protein
MRYFNSAPRYRCTILGLRSNTFLWISRIIKGAVSPRLPNTFDDFRAESNLCRGREVGGRREVRAGRRPGGRYSSAKAERMVWEMYETMVGMFESNQMTTGKMRSFGGGGGGGKGGWPSGPGGRACSVLGALAPSPPPRILIMFGLVRQTHIFARVTDYREIILPSSKVPGFSSRIKFPRVRS